MAKLNGKNRKFHYFNIIKEKMVKILARYPPSHCFKCCRFCCPGSRTSSSIRTTWTGCVTAASFWLWSSAVASKCPFTTLTNWATLLFITCWKTLKTLRHVNTSVKYVTFLLDSYSVTICSLRISLPMSQSSVWQKETAPRRSQNR